MQPYGKLSQAAICAAGLLAEYHNHDAPRRFSSAEIAKERQLSHAIVAKVLTVLSQAGVVTGAPGPRGGYSLARAPSEIMLVEIVGPFERLEPALVCPYGTGWCGNGPQCPLHKQLLAFRKEVSDFLKSTPLEVFQKADAKS